jgi:hypothetical protein
MKTASKKPLHVPKTVDQRRNSAGFPKAAELIEMKPTKELSLQGGRIFNALIENAVGQLGENVEHEIAVIKLRGMTHKGSERVHDSIKALMTTLIEIPTKDKNGLPAIRTTQLLSDNIITVDEDDPRAILKYRLTPTLREIINNSQRWGRLKGYVVYAFSSKYALALYEAVCVRINLNMSEQFFTVDAFRELLDVPDGKYQKFVHLRQRVIDPAILEVNGLSEFMAEIEPVREGGFVRGKLKGFNLYWRKKDNDEWDRATAELLRAKVGRRERLEGSVETVV